MSAKSLLGDAFVARIPEFARQFREAKPFRHIVIDNFLDPSVAGRMLGDCPSVSDPSKLVNAFGDPNAKNAVDQVVQVVQIASVHPVVDTFNQRREFLQTVEQLTSFADLKYEPWRYSAGA
ncbi:MAG: hypothetical protein ABL956_12835 [Hyphomonadaceae bacterium]